MTKMTDVAETIPLATLLRVEAIENIVVRRGTKRTDSMDHGSAPKQWRFGETDLRIKPEDLTGFDQPCRLNHSAWSQKIQTSQGIVVAKNAPRRLIGQFVKIWNLFHEAKPVYSPRPKRLTRSRGSDGSGCYPFHSRSLCLELSGPELAEIGRRGALEALVAVDGGVDLGGRKREAIVRWEVL